ncbi:MarR family winged helix-turn-helix transcriptional regulator [Oceanirhabdus sp. W0125-5]|uniref:MarR family winged helix-turn-helix transcriptional regulator n=1 Tax=Oceanirhabdus sp. W0125-5 TaxID=2999116 RepID=UPI0022F343CC|nr:MarR family transcriptional regulator [Oceanirhabdus sp. W0125-5]WBW95174.1 MarR family transcriptional regulator [Oceanirhabdus sp. W0125-5]
MDVLVALGIIRERINKELQIKLKENGIGINCGHIWLMSIVYFNDGKVEIKELVKQLEKKKSTITEMINTLEKNDFLIKYQSKEDKRVYYVEATTKAQEIKPQILDIIEEIKNKLLHSFLQDEKGSLNGYLERMVKNIE